MLINGTPYDDTLFGTTAHDIINGLAGNDIALGGAGDDIIFGGSGNDSIYGQDGNDNLKGDDGNDTVQGGNGDDIVLGGNGNDRLDGGGQDDSVYGQDGNDSITGGGGNDLVQGGDGNDTIDGGSGNDTINGGGQDDWLIAGAGNDTIDGGGGHDTLDLSANTAATTLLVGGPDLGDPDAPTHGTAIIGGEQDKFVNVEEFRLGSGNDHVESNASAPTVFYGGAGSDVFDVGDVNYDSDYFPPDGALFTWGKTVIGDFDTNHDKIGFIDVQYNGGENGGTSEFVTSFDELDTNHNHVLDNGDAHVAIVDYSLHGETLSSTEIYGKLILFGAVGLTESNIDTTG